MKTKKVIVPALSTLLIAAIVAAVSVDRVAVAAPSTVDFFHLRESVYELLYKHATTQIDGVSINLPPKEEHLERFRNPFPDQAHIRGVIDRQDWFGGGGFQLLLELDESISATVLLDHYFGALSELGFRNLGSPGIVAGTIHSAANEWFIEHDRRITVSGTVFVAPESKQAIVMCRVHESLPKQ